MEATRAVCFAQLSQCQLECSGGCGLRYCSRECALSTEDAHKDECKVFTAITQSRGAHLFGTLLHARHRNIRGFDSRMEGLRAGSHFQHLAPREREGYTAMAQGMIAKHLAPAGSIRCEELAELICLVHTSLHGISNLQGKVLGSGLYPEATFFNHSCNPNCILSFDGRRLEAHTISPVAIDEELCIAYTELYALRDVRKQALQAAKHFDCMCTRCSELGDGNLSKWMFDDVLEWKQESDERRWGLQISDARVHLQAGNIEHCLANLRGVLLEATTQLHPHHVTLYNARSMLVETLSDHPGASEYPSEVIVNAGACIKACETELSPFHPSVARMYEVIGRNEASPDKSMRAFREAALRLAVAYGKGHRDVRRLESHLGSKT